MRKLDDFEKRVGKLEDKNIADTSNNKMVR